MKRGQDSGRIVYQAQPAIVAVTFKPPMVFGFHLLPDPRLTLGSRIDSRLAKVAALIPDATNKARAARSRQRI